MIRLLVNKIYSSWNRLTRTQKTLSHAVVFLSLLVIGSMYVTTAAHAQVTDVFTKDFWVELIGSFLLWFADLFLSLTTFCLTFVLQLAGYNGYISSTAVGVGWVMVRDLTNMGFVVILLMIAFGTILGLEQYEWKKLLVKFAIAAILVNFSRIICGVLIDVAQVVMNTFVNGIAATAGGNLIGAFKLNSIKEFAQNIDPGDLSKESMRKEYFLACAGAVTFAAITFGMMLAFVVMLLMRMIVLWVLVVLSPLAFVLSVLPQTASYASRWWSEFTSNLITGPVLLFFIWLAFVTAGNGRINDEIVQPSNNSFAESQGVDATTKRNERSGLSQIMEWDSMANFAIAIGLLFVGARVAGEMGGMGSDLAGRATDFGKKVAWFATGAFAAKWAMDKSADAAKATGSYAARKMPLVGGEKWEQRAMAIKGWAEDKYHMLPGLGTRDRDAWVQDLEKKADREGGVKNKAKLFFVRSLFESNARTWARAENWKELGEQAHELREKSQSTSSTAGAKRKLNRTLQLLEAEEFKKKKGAEKFAAQREKLRKGLDRDSEIFKGLEEKSTEQGVVSEDVAKWEANEKKARAEQLRVKLELGKDEEYLANQDRVARSQVGLDTVSKRNAASSEKDLADAKEWWRVKSEEMNDKDREYRQRWGDSEEWKKSASTYSLQAKQIEEKLTAEKEIKILGEIKRLLEKDDQYRNNRIATIKARGTKGFEEIDSERASLLLEAGVQRELSNIVRANQLEKQADSLLFSKVQESFKTANLSANESGNVAATLVSQINALQKKGNLTQEEDNKLKNLLTQNAALMTVRASLGVYDANTALQGAVNAIPEFQGKNWEMADNPIRFWSALLGKQVNWSNLDQEIKNWEKALGPFAAGAKRQLALAQKNQMGQLNQHFIDILKEVNVDGRTDYVPAITDRDAYNAGYKDTIAGWKRAGDVDSSHAKQMIGTRGPGGGTLTAMSDDEMNTNLIFFQGANSNQIARMEGLLGDINNAKFTDGNKTIEKFLRNLSKTLANADALGAAARRIPNVLDDRMKQLVEELKEEMKG